MQRLRKEELSQLVMAAIAESQPIAPMATPASAEGAHRDFYFGAIAGFERTRQIILSHECEAEVVAKALVLYAAAGVSAAKNLEDPTPEAYVGVFQQSLELLAVLNLPLNVDFLAPGESVHFYAGLATALLEAYQVVIWTADKQELASALRARSFAVLANLKILVIRYKLPYSAN